MQNKYKSFTKTHRQNLSISHLGQIPWNKGKYGVQKCSDSTRKIISDALKSQWENGLRKGHKWSEKQKILASNRMINAWLNNEVNGFTKENTEGDKNVNWKGDMVGYTALHDWIVRKLGKANQCDFCSIKNKRYTWANKSGEYKRDIKDWLKLCYSCHKLYDLKRNK